jgi:sec-independent protein translocase protein TatA
MPFIGHLPELIIVMVLALLVFGPKRLPEMGSAVGKTIKEFRKTMSEATTEQPTSTPQLPSAITVPTVTTETPVSESPTK